MLGFYDVVGAFDHATGEAWLTSSGLPSAGPAREARAQARLDAFERRLAAAAGPPPHTTPPSWAIEAPRSTFDRAGYLIFANPSAARILGYSPETSLGRPMWELVPPSQRDRLPRWSQYSSRKQMASSMRRVT